MEEESWYWGPIDMAIVDTCLQNEENGAFLVFFDQETDFHVLAYRENDTIVYKNIIFRDHYYGFTEPLGFESLAELINAFNWSPATEGLLETPISRNVIAEEPVNPIELLLNIRDNEREIMVKSGEVDDIVGKIQQIERDLDEEFSLIGLSNDKGKEEIQNAIDGLEKVSRMLDIQIQRHRELNKRGSQGLATCISDNYSLLLDRQFKVQSSKMEKEGILAEKEQYKRDLLHEYNACKFAIESSREQQEDSQRLLLRSYPQLREFVEYLLQDIPITYPSPKVNDIRVSEAEKRLTSTTTETGTFLVRVSRRQNNIPFGVCVCRDGKVIHFPVYEIGGYYGFNETLCIFESLEDLVNSYRVIPFRIHGEQYGELRLTLEKQD